MGLAESPVCFASPEHHWLGHCDLCAAGAGVCAAKECDVDKCNRGRLGSSDRNIRLRTRRSPLEIVGFTRPLFLGRSWSARDGWMGIAGAAARAHQLGSRRLCTHGHHFLFFGRHGQAWTFGEPDRARRIVLVWRMGVGASAAATGRASRGRNAMNLSRKGIILTVLQLAIVVSLAAKYALDRARFPRVWAQTVAYDPDLPIRGRYLS